MRVTLAVVADYANTTSEGKLNIMGIFNSVNAAAFPTNVHEMRLVVKYQFTPAERKSAHTIQVKFLDPDGAELLGLAQPFQVPDNALNPEVTQVIDLRGIPLPKAGDYAFHILMDEQEQARVPLYAVLAPSLQGA